MPARATKDDSFNFRVEPDLKTAFTAAAADNGRPAGQILRDFMRRYIAARNDFATEAERQSRLVAESPDEAETLRWIDDVGDTKGWR